MPVVPQPSPRGQAAIQGSNQRNDATWLQQPQNQNQQREDAATIIAGILGRTADRNTLSGNPRNSIFDLHSQHDVPDISDLLDQYERPQTRAEYVRGQGQTMQLSQDQARAPSRVQGEEEGNSSISRHDREMNLIFSRGMPRDSISKYSLLSPLPLYQCLNPGYDHTSSRADESDDHKKAHLVSPSEEKLDCPGEGCERLGANGFESEDLLTEHLISFHVWDIPNEHSRDSASSGEDKDPGVEHFKQAEHEVFDLLESSKDQDDSALVGVTASVGGNPTQAPVDLTFVADHSTVSTLLSAHTRQSLCQAWSLHGTTLGNLH